MYGIHLLLPQAIEHMAMVYTLYVLHPDGSIVLLCPLEEVLHLQRRPELSKIIMFSTRTSQAQAEIAVTSHGLGGHS